MESDGAVLEDAEADVAPAAEEVLTSLLGALVLQPGPGRDALVDRATFDLLRGGASVDVAARLIGNLWNQLGAIL